MALLAGIESALADAGTALMLRFVRYGDDLAVYRQWHAEHRVDGVFLTDLRVDDPRPALLEQLGLPSLVHGGRRADDGWRFGQEEEAELLVGHLAALGHRSVLHVAGPADLVHELERRRAVEAAGRAAGMQVQTLTADYTHRGAEAQVEAAFGAGAQATAVVCSNDLMAVGAMRSLRRVKRDHPIALVSWDESVLCETAEPAITAVERHPYEAGRTSASLLLAALDGAALEPRALPRRLSCGRRAFRRPEPATRVQEIHGSDRLPSAVFRRWLKRVSRQRCRAPERGSVRPTRVGTTVRTPEPLWSTMTNRYLRRGGAALAGAALLVAAPLAAAPAFAGVPHPLSAAHVLLRTEGAGRLAAADRPAAALGTPGGRGPHPSRGDHAAGGVVHRRDPEAGREAGQGDRPEGRREAHGADARRLRRAWTRLLPVLLRRGRNRRGLPRLDRRRREGAVEGREGDRDRRAGRPREPAHPTARAPIRARTSPLSPPVASRTSSTRGRRSRRPTGTRSSTWTPGTAAGTASRTRRAGSKPQASRTCRASP